MNLETAELGGGLPLLMAPAPETPRMALAVTMRGGTAREATPGVSKLASRLLLKGTARRTAEALAYEIDARGIDLREITLPDCGMLLAVFLTREFDAVLDLLTDILFHSTFADLDKERTKLAGEIQSALDVPAEQAQDLLARTLFPAFPYGNTGTRILAELGGIDAATVQQWHADGLDPRAMNVVLVGDFQPADVLPRLADAFAGLAPRPAAPALPEFVPLLEEHIVTEARADAHQAQVYQGWYAPRLGAPEQAATAVMNTILGGAGLSSRLFTELRDKQGLAYSVRSAYVAMGQAGELQLAIGTSPGNIGRALLGFTEQLHRIREEPVSIEELQAAKGRLNGTFVMSHETNRQRCVDLAINHILGLGPDYSEVLLQRTTAVTVPDVQAYQ